jgi:glucan biosynthesis protein
MEIKQCEFDQPVEKRSSTGFYKGMFNEDVGFRFLVDVKVTDRKDVESRLKLFELATTSFKETWQNVLAKLH